MTRTRRGYIARRRRTKMRSFAVGWASALTGTSVQYQIKALYSAYRDRGRQKRNFRRLWIIRINALIRKMEVSNSYSRFIHDMYKTKGFLNRKTLSQIATFDPNCFYRILNSKNDIGFLALQYPSIKLGNSPRIILYGDEPERNNINGVPRRMNPGKLE